MIIPHFAASAPVKRRPPINRSVALARPTFFVSIWVIPQSGTKPIFTKANTIFASSAARAKSQQSAMLIPAPAAAPSIQAMVGLLMVRRRIMNSPPARMPSFVVLMPLSRRSFMPFTFPPAEKLPPAPRSTITRTVSSSSHRVRASTR